MRSLLILLRWNSAVIIAEVLCLFQFDYEVSIWIILASIIIMRLSENFLKKQIKYVFIMKQIIVVIIIKILILLLLVFTILCELYFYLMIENQTNFILSYCSAILIDIFLQVIEQLFTQFQPKLSSSSEKQKECIKIGNYKRHLNIGQIDYEQNQLKSFNQMIQDQDSKQLWKGKSRTKNNQNM